MSCDNFSSTVNQEYVDVVNAIELIFNSKDCNGLIVCGDFNTPFIRSNAQSGCLNDVMNKNRLIIFLSDFYIICIIQAILLCVVVLIMLL